MISTHTTDRIGDTWVARLPQGLEDLVGDPAAFFAEHWGKEPVVLRAAADTTQLISEEEMWAELDCGLLSRPYFTMFNEGVRPTVGDMTTTRTVVGHDVPGFADKQRIHADFANGSTFKYSQAEHWHPRIRALVLAMEPHFRGELEAFVFLSPPGKTAMKAHMDGSHVLVIQVAGVKDWFVGRLTNTSVSASALHEGHGGTIADDELLRFTLYPGDVLYMPHGCPHYATAREGNTIHVAITIEEPSAEDLANVYLARCMADPRFVDLIDDAARGVGLPARVERVRDAILASLGETDPQTALQAAVRLRRLHK